MEEKFDIVFAADAMFHTVDDEKFKAAIRYVACVLKTGGLLIIFRHPSARDELDSTSRSFAI